jgi:hypothetical protein
MGWAALPVQPSLGAIPQPCARPTGGDSAFAGERLDQRPVCYEQRRGHDGFGHREVPGSHRDDGRECGAVRAAPQFRPTTSVYVPVDLCDATNGRLEIEPNGDVLVEAEGGTFANAQCFTSLDGASFVP